jgi:hypothetical protein
MMPIYVIVIFSLIGLGALLFQVGRAATLRTDAQTAADAAALAGAKELSEQLFFADGSVGGLDEAAVRAAAADYAAENDAELIDFELNACGARVEVRTEQELDGSEAEQIDAEGDAAEAHAAASMGPSLGAGPIGLFGAPVDGSVPEVMKPAAQLARRLGLQITSTTGGSHTPGSYHYQGLAIDVSNSSSPTPQMAAFYNAAKRIFAGRLLELFYDPLGGIKDNQEIGQIGGHSDHVHIALAPGRNVDLDELGSTELVGPVAGPQLVPYEQVSECALDGADSLLSAFSGYGGFTPSASSAEIASAICRIGREIGVSDKIMLSAFETAIVESGVRNLPDGDRDSAGVFQQRPSQGWGSYAQVTNVAYAANTYFRRAIAADRPGLTPGQLAQAVQRSAYPLKYDAAQADARALMEQVGCT